jgi:hypothetical protein
MVYEEKCYPQPQIVYLANYVMTLAAMTDKSQSPEVFTRPSADYYAAVHMYECIYLTRDVMGFCAYIEVSYRIAANIWVIANL